MPNNTRWTIIEGVKTAIEAVTTGNGYQFTVNTVEYQLKHFNKMSVEQTPAIFIIDGGDEIIDRVEEAGIEYIRARMTLSLLGIVKTAASVTETFNKHINDVKTAIEAMSLGVDVHYKRYLGDTRPDMAEYAGNDMIYIADMEVVYKYTTDDSTAPYRLVPFAETYCCYNFEGSLDDSSGNGANLTSNNITATDYVANIDGTAGSAIDITGYRNITTDEYGYRQLIDPAIDLGTDDFTIEIVFKPKSTAETSLQGLVGKKEHAGVSSIGWELNLRDATQWTSLYIGDGTNGVDAGFNNDGSPPNSRCADDTWVYLACVVDRTAGTAELYKDAVADPDNPVDISSVTLSVYNNTKKFYVGFHESSPHHSFTGVIGAVCVTGRKLTTAEITARLYS